MTFDEMIEKVLNNEDYNTDGLSVDDVITLIEYLRLEYAPTVEMTEEQKDIIIGLLDDSDIGRDDWDNMINDDSPELPKISYRQAIMAYMNPETIKIIDE